MGSRYTELAFLFLSSVLSQPSFQARTIQAIENRLDMENKATYMTVSIQQWLAARLDLSGNAVILGIGLFAAGLRKSVDPSKVRASDKTTEISSLFCSQVGVVLSFTLSSE